MLQSIFTFLFFTVFASQALANIACRASVSNIAIIGWGSLVWAPVTSPSQAALKLIGGWKANGPRLPLEFARLTRDGRLSLVIQNGTPRQPTYWATSEYYDLASATSNLVDREGVTLDKIAFHSLSDRSSRDIPRIVDNEMNRWLRIHSQTKWVLWTALRSNWNKMRGQRFNLADAKKYILEQIASGNGRQIERYIRRTPADIRTPLRIWAETELGWLPIP